MSNEDTESRLHEWYCTGDPEGDFYLSGTARDITAQTQFPDITEELMNTKEEQYVQAKDDLRRLLFGSTADQTEKVLEITYYYQQWREHAYKIMEEVTNKILSECLDHYQSRYKSFSETYIRRLEVLLSQKTQAYETEKSMLSEEEKQLQIDNEWFNTFKKQLEELKRG